MLFTLANENFGDFFTENWRDGEDYFSSATDLVQKMIAKNKDIFANIIKKKSYYWPDRVVFIRLLNDFLPKVRTLST